MRINNIEKGMLARAKAGHDKNQVYVIYDVDQTYVYLVDGKNRTLEFNLEIKVLNILLI